MTERKDERPKAPQREERKEDQRDRRSSYGEDIAKANVIRDTLPPPPPPKDES